MIGGQDSIAAGAAEMAKRATFLKGEYAGYRAALDRLAADEELTQVGPGTPGGGVSAKVLASGRVRRRAQGRAAPGPRAGRGPRAVQGQVRPSRASRAPLPAPGHVARIRHRPGTRHHVLLSRLGVRRERPDPGDPGRAGRQHAQGPAVARRLPGARVQGAGLRLYGAARGAPALPGLRFVRA